MLRKCSGEQLHYGKCLAGQCHLCHRFQDRLWAISYVTQNMQIGSVHVLTAGQQHSHLGQQIMIVVSINGQLLKYYMVLFIW